MVPLCYLFIYLLTVMCVSSFFYLYVCEYVRQTTSYLYLQSHFYSSVLCFHVHMCAFVCVCVCTWQAESPITNNLLLFHPFQPALFFRSSLAFAGSVLSLNPPLSWLSVAPRNCLNLPLTILTPLPLSLLSFLCAPLTHTSPFLPPSLPLSLLHSHHPFLHFFILSPFLPPLTRCHAKHFPLLHFPFLFLFLISIHSLSI